MVVVELLLSSAFLVSWTNGVVGTVECVFGWVGGARWLGVTQPSPRMANIAQHFRDCHSLCPSSPLLPPAQEEERIQTSA